MGWVVCDTGEPLDQIHRPRVFQQRDESIALRCMTEVVVVCFTGTRVISQRADSTSRKVPAIIETAPDATTVLLAGATGGGGRRGGCTPKTRPNMDTLPSSMPKTISPDRIAQ